MKDEKYIQRCLQLAKLGASKTGKNPLVGSVLVFKDKIIGEGYHEKYGGPHAEINCLASVADENQQLISQSTIYVNLEPCNHTGKTPPCTDAIIQAKIPKVVIGTRDINPLVSGKGIQRLKKQGIEVVSEICVLDCLKLNRVFFTNQKDHRAYLKLKWAETANGYIGETEKNLKISNSYSDIITHKYRTLSDGILVGYNTAIKDNPKLNSRNWLGKQPARIFIDWECKLPDGVINQPNQRNIVINSLKTEKINNVEYIKSDTNAKAIAQALYTIDICSVIIEGGAQTHKLFIEENIWDEAVIIKSNRSIENGIPAARIKSGVQINQQFFKSDLITHISNSEFLK